jgi:hypothetical protein
VSFAESLRAWHDFFLLAGGGAATLLGLVFVAVSLANDLPKMPQRHERQLFVSPILAQFGYAFGISATNLVPWHNQERYGAFVALLGVSAFVQSGWLLRGMLQRHRGSARVELRYWIWTGVLPFLASLAITISGAVTYGTSREMFGGVAGAVVLLDLMGVRNTWQLVMWIFAARVPD